ncbi:MAG: hypothetical protein M3Q13_02895, partial [Pseudomonadota bacterium]|nr:hypothetical protein [Pseudomonadota bacterium]
LEDGERAALLDMLFTAVDRGTGKAARLTVPVFGKTGTTQDYHDALFIGLAKDVAVGVWVGNDDNTPMRNVTGGGLPAQIWAEFTAKAVDARVLGARPTQSARNRGESRPSRWQSLRNRFFGRGKGNKGGKGKKGKKR